MGIQAIMFELAHIVYRAQKNSRKTTQNKKS